MKKCLSIILILFTLLFIFASCDNFDTDTSKNTSQNTDTENVNSDTNTDTDNNKNDNNNELKESNVHLKETDKNVYVITNSTQNSLFKHGKVHIFEICDTSDGVNLEDKFASANILEFNISDKITFEYKKLWN